MPTPGLRLALLLAAACLALRLASSLVARFQVANRSMLPALAPGDRILVLRHAHRLRVPRRGDIVVVRHPLRPGVTSIKRLAALPGDSVDLPAPARLSPGQHFVVGDNLAESRDSRHFGPIDRDALVGRAWYRYWPPHKRGRL